MYFSGLTKYCSGISLIQVFVSITFQISSHFIRISFDIASSKNINGLTLALYGNMKRGPESFEGMASHGAEMKRSRGGNKIEVRILIPSKIAGSIIGKSGANIQQLRNNNNANVRVPDCEGPERVMNVLVDDAETAINVIEQVCK